MLPIQFKKILVANRGEIASRIFRACKNLGVASVAVYSTADKDAKWVREADFSVELKGTTSSETYLNQSLIFDACKQTNATVIHPGYGFLSENADFAQACADAGIKFIGPSPEAMRLMGSKAISREIAEKAGVPVTPGVDGAKLDKNQLLEEAERIGYPVLIKASAGGGGKGMRVVESSDDFSDALQAAQSEARNSFGGDRVILERYFTAIHHIEIQILGDEHGNVVHLFERECSIQRRHQKIIEETPSPTVSSELRDRIADAAVSLAKSVEYASAGTVEFMTVAGSDDFYFLEMNTRLQVEHPITELVTGIDLAEWQIRIANGETIGFDQEDLRQSGHAIECRIYAEDPAQNFLPSIGRIAHYAPPSGLGIRVDDGIEAGGEVTPFYDPMLAKLIVHAADRDSAIRRMLSALRETVLLGVTTNIPYLIDILEQQRFQNGDTPTSYLEQEMLGWKPSAGLEDASTELGRSDLLIALAAGELLYKPAVLQKKRPTDSADVWELVGAWRNV